MRAQARASWVFAAINEYIEKRGIHPEQDKQ
jgi:hypothetical protein